MQVGVEHRAKDSVNPHLKEVAHYQRTGLPGTPFTEHKFIDEDKAKVIDVTSNEINQTEGQSDDRGDKEDVDGDGGGELKGRDVS